MARSHVPKFGEWDNDDLPYTTYFENARKEKSGKIMNPNDPEENPEAFMYMRGGQESNQDCGHGHGNVPFAIYSANKQAGKIMNPNDPEENPEALRGGLESNYDCCQHAHVPMADKHSLNRDHLGRTSSGPKNGQAGGGSFSSSVSGQSQRNGKYEYRHHRTTSVPKFGEWDETDPASAAGFTVIFNKVKEEKHAPPASGFATVAPQVKTMNYSDSHHTKCPTPSWASKSKICCCLF